MAQEITQLLCICVMASLAIGHICGLMKAANAFLVYLQPGNVAGG